MRARGNAATQKLPAAWPLGNEPSRGVPNGGGSPSIIQGLTRPTASLRAQNQDGLDQKSDRQNGGEGAGALVPEHWQKKEGGPAFAHEGERQHQWTEGSVRAAVDGLEDVMVERNHRHREGEELYAGLRLAQT